MGLAGPWTGSPGLPFFCFFSDLPSRAPNRLGKCHIYCGVWSEVVVVAHLGKPISTASENEFCSSPTPSIFIYMSYYVCHKSNLTSFDKIYRKNIIITILSNIYTINLYFMVDSMKQIWYCKCYYFFL